LRNNLLIGFLFFSITAHAADSLVMQLDVRTSFFTTDHYLNLYFVNEKNEIVKYNFITKDSVTYSNKQLGTPTYIDAGNPLKVLVLYPDFNSIVVLDNKMAEIALFRFNASGTGNFYKPLAACRETDGDLMWIYDELTQKMIGLNEQGEKLYESESFDMLFTDPVLPVQLLFGEQKLYLVNSDKQVYIFDRFANFDSRLDPHEKMLQQVVRTKLIFLKDNEISFLDFADYTPVYQALPVDTLLQANIQGAYLFIRTSEAILIYTN